MKTITMSYDAQYAAHHDAQYTGQHTAQHDTRQEVSKSGTAGECFTFALIGAIAMALVLVLMTAIG